MKFPGTRAVIEGLGKSRVVRREAAIQFERPVITINARAMVHAA